MVTDSSENKNYKIKQFIEYHLYKQPIC